VRYRSFRHARLPLNLRGHSHGVSTGSGDDTRVAVVFGVCSGWWSGVGLPGSIGADRISRWDVGTPVLRVLRMGPRSGTGRRPGRAWGLSDVSLIWGS
jgi:hypothetical protein